MAEKLSENVDRLVMEMRPNLRSCNMFLILKQAVDDVEIQLNLHSINLSFNNKNLMIPCDDFEILPNSLTSLHIDNKHVACRFSTNVGGNNSVNFGSFKTEVLEVKKNDAFNGFCNPKEWLEEAIDYEICCCNCRQILKNARFGRVLPLPSDCLDFNEWFCHKHDSDGFSILEPKLTDIFYSGCYVHLNSQLLSGVVVSENKIIVCKRCLFWLGIAVHKNTHKLWFNTISFDNNGKTHKSQALNDAFGAIGKVLNNTLHSCVKLDLSCANSSGADNHICLWVIEKRLNVYLHTKESEFRNTNVAKVLFKFESGENNAIRQWLSDANVTNVAISKPMSVELLKFLYKMNKLCPKHCRMSNDFFLSYLMLEEDDDFL